MGHFIGGCAGICNRAVSKRPSGTPGARSAKTARSSLVCCVSRDSSQQDLTRRQLGTRVVKGAVASAIPLGLGVAVEEYVAPAGVTGALIELKGTSMEDITTAKDLLASGDSALGSRRIQEAVEAYSAVLDTAPTQYTLCMKSLLGRREALAALGQSDASGSDNRREFAWGRGIRWPGWYIIGLIMFRNEIARD